MRPTFTLLMLLAAAPVLAQDSASSDSGSATSTSGASTTQGKKTARKVSRLAFMDVTSRVAKTLIDLTEEPDAMTHPKGSQIRISRQEISRIVGCSREMVGRVLKQLEDQGMITVTGKTIVVLGTR